jgi:hypothetical protein
MSKNIPETDEVLFKSHFSYRPIRPLSIKEQKFADNISQILNGIQDSVYIAVLPSYLSKDQRTRPLILNRKIIEKITINHGSIPLENLIINANDFDFFIQNLDGNPDKINLIKLIPGTQDFVLIGANRDNGYFLVTHYEVTAKSGNELKSLLGRGDFLDKSGFPLEPLINGAFFCQSKSERVSDKDTVIE